MIIIQIIIISLLVFAIHYTMLPGEIFGFIDKWWQKHEDDYFNEADRLNGLADELELTATNRYDAAEIDYKRRDADALIKKANFLDKLSQPLFRCPVCMAPWYGTALYWVIPWPRLWLPAHDWVHWLIVIICTLGLNSIVVRLFKEDD